MESIFNHKHIIIGNDSFRLLAVMQAIGKEGIMPIVVMYSNGKGFATYHVQRSRYAKQIHIVQTAEDGLKLIIDIYGKESLKPFLYSLAEIEIRLVDDHYDELKDKFYFFNGGGQRRLHPWFEKIAQCQLARKCGLLVPESEIVAKGELPQSVPYPIFVKATNSINIGWKEDAAICHTEEELLKAYETFKGSSFLVQQYIPKAKERTFQGFSINGGKNIYIPFSIFYEERLIDLDFGSYSYGEKRLNDEIVNEISAMLRAINFSGVFEGDFIVSKEQKTYFMEINLRPAGAVKMSLYGGANLILLWAQSTLDGYINEKEISLKDKRFYALDEDRDFYHSVIKYKYISIWRWLYDLFTTEVLFRFDKNDPLPGILYWRDWIWRSFKSFLLVVLNKKQLRR